MWSKCAVVAAVVIFLAVANIACECGCERPATNGEPAMTGDSRIFESKDETGFTVQIQKFKNCEELRAAYSHEVNKMWAKGYEVAEIVDKCPCENSDCSDVIYEFKLAKITNNGKKDGVSLPYGSITGKLGRTMGYWPSN